MSAMQAGEADMLTVKPGKVAADMAAAGLVVKTAAIDTSVLIPDTANADSPWANQKVREAAEYSIDHEAISKGMGYGYTKPAYQIPGSSVITYDPNFPLARKYDVEKAKQLMTDAGMPNGFKTSIFACPFSLNRDAAVAVQGYLAKIGIQADVQYPDAGKFTTDYMLGKWKNGVVYEPIAGFPNYMNIFSILFNPITNWHASWQRTPEWLDAYNAALAAPTPDVKLMRTATDVITKYALMIPVNEGGRGWAYKSYVMDIGVLETNLPPFLKFEQAWLNK
jgi:ABC-type transport system substrate-binding protein